MTDPIGASLSSIIEAAVAKALADKAPSKTDEHELLTRKETAELLRCSLRQVDLLRQNHGMPSLRLGDCYRYRKTELLQWMRERAGR